VEGPPQYLFQTPTQVAVDDRGRIAVADWGGRTVRVFDAEGRVLVEVGGEGDGPAEFPSNTVGLTLGDSSVAVTSGGPRVRVSHFALDGRLIGSRDFTLGIAYHLQLLGDELRVWSTPNLRADRVDLPEGVLVPEPVEVYAADLQDGELRELFSVPGGLLMSTGTYLDAPPLFEPAPRAAPGPEGTVVTTSGDGYELRVLGPGLEPLRIVRRAYEPLPVPGDVEDRWDEALEAALDRLPLPTREEAFVREQRRRRRHTASHVPPVTGLRVGHDGSMWVRRIDLEEDPAEAGIRTVVPLPVSGPRPLEVHDVFGPDGRYVGSLRLDARADAVGVDWVVRTERDDLGVPYVVRYALRPR